MMISIANSTHDDKFHYVRNCCHSLPVNNCSFVLFALSLLMLLLWMTAFLNWKLTFALRNKVSRQQWLENRFRVFLIGHSCDFHVMTMTMMIRVVLF